MPDSRRDQMRQAQWIKRETKRRIAQEQADALTALGVPCAARSGWVALLDPFGLLVKLDPNGAVTGWPQTPATEATLPAVTTPAPEPHSGKGGGSDAAEGHTATCGTHWGSHGCDLPLGHDGACFCGVYVDPCSQFDPATNAVRFNSADYGEPIVWSDWLVQGQGDLVHPNPPDYPSVHRQQYPADAPTLAAGEPGRQPADDETLAKRPGERKVNPFTDLPPVRWPSEGQRG